MSFEDKGPAQSGSASCTFHADDIAASLDFRKDLIILFGPVLGHHAGGRLGASRAPTGWGRG